MRWRDQRAPWQWPTTAWSRAGWNATQRSRSCQSSLRTANQGRTQRPGARPPIFDVSRRYLLIPRLSARSRATLVASLDRYRRRGGRVTLAGGRPRQCACSAPLVPIGPGLSMRSGCLCDGFASTPRCAHATPRCGASRVLLPYPSQAIEPSPGGWAKGAILTSGSVLISSDVLTQLSDGRRSGAKVGVREEEIASGRPEARGPASARTLQRGLVVVGDPDAPTGPQGRRDAWGRRGRDASPGRLCARDGDHGAVGGSANRAPVGPRKRGAVREQRRRGEPGHVQDGPRMDPELRRSTAAGRCARSHRDRVQGGRRV